MLSPRTLLTTTTVVTVAILTHSTVHANSSFASTLESVLDETIIDKSHDAATTTNVAQLDSAGFPDDLSICDEYFFGRQASNLPSAVQPFCVNGGYCKASWVRDPDAPCECLATHEGPHCEFDKGALSGNDNDNDRDAIVCRLGCENNGVCKLGSPTWQHYYRTTQGYSNPLDLQHCACPDGFTGLLCEVKGNPCGESHCHNGGTCIQTNTADGSNKHFCDCSTATSGDGTRAYAGEYCEHEATSYCTEESDQNGHQFCVNEGTCKGESHLGCHCKDGFVGPVCEFEDRGEPPEECSLTCENHGICRKGAKDVSSLSKFGLHDRRHLQEAYNEDFEHCVCPRGFVGLQCEFQLDICPGGFHACLNGGECVTVPNGKSVQYACNCTKAETELTRFAGSSCEMESTQFCTVDGSKSQPGIGVHSFCTNGGTCNDFVPLSEEHPGCGCDEGFEGKNCQYIASTKAGVNVLLIVSGVLVAGSFVAVLFMLRFKKRKSEHNLYDNVLKRGHGMPPTLNIIAAALGHDREAEYTENSDTLMYNHTAGVSRPFQSNSLSVSNSEDLVYIRKTNWPGEESSSGIVADPIHIFRDAESNVAKIRESRMSHWPNDAHNDASNPIHVFDDISVDSEALTRSSIGSRGNKSSESSSMSSASDGYPGIV